MVLCLSKEHLLEEEDTMIALEILYFSIYLVIFLHLFTTKITKVTSFDDFEKIFVFSLFFSKSSRFKLRVLHEVKIYKMMQN